MTARRAGATAAISGFVILAAAGCGSRGPIAEAAPPSSPPATDVPVDARADLTRRVAAAKDRRFNAAYTWTGSGGQRTVTVTVAADRSWRVDVGGGPSLVGRPDGVYHCASTGCVRVARTAATVPSAYDVKVHHPFTDWLSVLTDRDAAVAVAVVDALPGASGTCFSVEPTTVAISPPIDPGVFCYDDTGLPTAIRARFGTLVVAGPAGPAPPSATLTGPVAPGPGPASHSPGRG